MKHPSTTDRAMPLPRSNPQSSLRHGTVAATRRLERYLARPRGLLTGFVCAVTLLAGGCGTTLDGVFPDGRRLATAPTEWAGASVLRGGRRIVPEKYLPLEKGDQIQTDARTYALIRFESGTEAYLAPNSRGRIGSLFEFFGEVLAKVRGNFEVKTQYITAAAKGTVFLVRSSSEGVAEVITLEGVVQVSSNAARWNSIDLQAGEKARIVRDQPPARTSVAQGELDDIERRYRPIEEAAPISKGAAAGTGLAIGAVVGIIIHNQIDKGGKPRQTQETPPGTTQTVPAKPIEPSQ